MSDVQLKSSLEPAPPALRLFPNRASLTQPKCWLIGNSPESPLAVGRIARLRGLEVEICPADGSSIPSLDAARNQLLAINFDQLARLAPDEKVRLRELAENGATIYVRGALVRGRRYSLRPFSDQQFEFSKQLGDGYQFSEHPILPGAIAGERINTQLNMPVGAGLARRARPLVSSLHRAGAATPSIFSIEAGDGLAIFDLHPDHDSDEYELLAELASPSTRTASVGALAAVDRAAGRNPTIPAPINLVIDDRPINYDYFNAGTLQAFLQHLDDQCPGIHTDFAWTPNHTRPHRKYLDVLGRHHTGFVWHGFLRHVDHRTITDFESQLGAGRARVDEIARRYGVRFQRVMIFPYEKDTQRAAELLRRTGFVAKVQSMDGPPPADYYRLRGIVDEPPFRQGFSVIFRDSIEVRTRGAASPRSFSAPVSPGRPDTDVVLRFRAEVCRGEVAATDATRKDRGGSSGRSIVAICQLS